MPTSERALKAFEMKQSGAKLREIAFEFGISKSQAVRLVAQGERHDPSPLGELSERLKNVLSAMTETEYPSPPLSIERALSVAPEDMKNWPNAGKETVAEFIAWRSRHRGIVPEKDPA